MEECEALCDRLAIMAQGQFRCLGGKQHLKSKFGQGFTIIVKLNPRSDEYDDEDTVEGVKAFLRAELGDGLSVKDEHADYLHLHVPAGPSWHQLFEAIEKLKVEFEGAVEDYTVSETTLEQVFLSFARKYKDATKSQKEKQS